MRFRKIILLGFLFFMQNAWTAEMGTGKSSPVVQDEEAPADSEEATGLLDAWVQLERWIANQMEASK